MRAARRVLQLGAVACVLASLPSPLFDLDRHQVPKELVSQYVEAIKTGARGVGYVRVNPSAEWPDWLQKNLLRADRSTPPREP